uniref:RRM domain-containing protein n=1 Tax=Noccaea caerulescens TaxID=107243 RepID=A0A1J3FYE9_NOCCA
MFAARVRASLKPLLHGRHSSYLTRNCEIAANSKRLLLERFKYGERTLTSLRLSGNGAGIKLFHRSFHSSSHSQCCTSESDVEVKPQTSTLFSSLEDDFSSELGSVEKYGNQNMVVKLLTTALEPLEVDKEDLSQKTKGKKKKKKKKKPEQDSDTICKPKLLTEKPSLSWETSGKRKTEAHASSPARNGKGSNASSSSPDPGQKSKPQNITSSGFKAKNETSSKASKHPSSLAVIRISNLNSETTDSVIRTMCLKIGPLEGLARVNEDTADVLFRARNLNEADSILKELNEATVDHSQWRAEIVPEAGEASRDEMGMRVSSCFEDLEKQMTMQRILSKDLEVLLHLVTHLESHPMSRDKALEL